MSKKRTKNEDQRIDFSTADLEEKILVLAVEYARCTPASRPVALIYKDGATSLLPMLIKAVRTLKDYKEISVPNNCSGVSRFSSAAQAIAEIEAWAKGQRKHYDQ